VVPLTLAALSALTDEMPERYRAMILVGAGLGLRQGECFGLTVDHIDFLRRTVRIDQQVILPDYGVPEVAPLKTPASYRTIPLPSLVGEALARHLGQFEPGQFALIFTDDNGQALKRNRWNEVLSVAVKRSGIRQDVTFHDLRHFYASALIFAGQSVKVVQARLGHATAIETLNTYSHLWPDDEDGTRQAIDGLFERSVSNWGPVEASGS
jgi:integrase